MFVIYHEKTNGYLSLKGAEFKGWTEDISKAHKFSTEDKAKNVLSLNFKKRFADIMSELSIIEYGCNIKQDSAPKVSDEQAKEMMENVDNVLAQVAAIKSDIPALIAYYNKQLSHYDMMTQDILHKIELEDIPNLLAVRLCKQLKQARIKRREAKDKLMLLSAISGGITATADNVEKYNNTIETRTYKPRVLPELFDK